MEFILRVFSIFFLIIQVAIGRVVCESQEVIFELKDGELNQVIFSGEKNITLVCHVSNTLHANVTISKIGGGSVASNNAIGNCLEYTIPEVIEQNEYSCMARYRDVNTGQMVKMSKSLSLNVKNTSRSVCFRNGTMSQEEYGEGDTLLLSCYCIDALECFWSETEVGTELGNVVHPKYRYKHNNKVLLQIVVGPLTSMDINIRYDCVHGSESSERCSIGPADVSINDTILQPIPSSDDSEGCPPLVTPITGMIPEAMSSTSGKMKDNDFSTSKKVKFRVTAQHRSKAEEIQEFPLDILIIVAALLMLLVIALLLLFVLIRKNRGGKTDQNHDKNPEARQVTNSQDKEDVYAEPVKKHAIGDNVSKAIKVEANDAGDEGEELYIPEVSEYSIPAALRRDAFGEKNGADEGDVFCIPDVSEYSIPAALRRDASREKDRADDGEVFCIPDVSEYGILTAFRRDAFGDKDHDADEGEELCIPEVSEYSIPVAFMKVANARQREEN